MKILVVGDSYATNYSKLSWTSIVEDHFNCIADNHARPASGLNYSYMKLTKSLSEKFYDVVIFALTSADRPYHRNILIHGGFPQYLDGTPVSSEIKDAVDAYYLHLFDPINSSLSHSVFCRAIAQLSLDYSKTKFIFLPAFDEFEKIKLGNCVVTSKRLLYYSMLDKKGHAAEIRGKNTEKNNHLTFLQNKTLANYIIDFIENYEFGTVTYKNLDNLEILK